MHYDKKRTRINGKRYDIETAKKVGIYGREDGSFRDFTETLYRKRTGEFFLHGMGGPMTRYSHESNPGTWGYGCDFIPLTLAQAKKWAETKLDGDEYEAIFGPVEE